MSLSKLKLLCQSKRHSSLFFTTKIEILFEMRLLDINTDEELQKSVFEEKVKCDSYNIQNDYISIHRDIQIKLSKFLSELDSDGWKVLNIENNLKKIINKLFDTTQCKSENAYVANQTDITLSKNESITDSMINDFLNVHTKVV